MDAVKGSACPKAGKVWALLEVSGAARCSNPVSPLLDPAFVPTRSGFGGGVPSAWGQAAPDQLAGTNMHVHIGASQLTAMTISDRNDSAPTGKEADKDAYHGMMFACEVGLSSIDGSRAASLRVRRSATIRGQGGMDMKDRIAVVILAAALLCAFGAASALAAPKSSVHFEVTKWLIPGYQETFVASGQAVADGLIPATGLALQSGFAVSPSPEGEGFLIFTVVETFLCNDGTFDVELVVTFDVANPHTWGTWKVLGGTGTYANLTGNGKIHSEAGPSPEQYFDEYDGSLKDAPLLDVEIVVPTPLPAGPDIAFSARGPAVGRGLLCGTGTVSTGPIATSPSPLGDRYSVLSMVKYFHCGVGTFDVRLVVTLDNWTGSTTGEWRILSGTGDYAHLKGNGTLVGAFDPWTYSVLDTYSGRLHR